MVIYTTEYYEHVKNIWEYLMTWRNLMINCQIKKARSESEYSIGFNCVKVHMCACTQ